MSKQTSRKLFSAPQFAKCNLGVLGCMWLHFFVAAALLAAGPMAHARETYGNFVVRVTENPPRGAQFRDDLERLLLDATNDYRAGKGLPALAAADGQLVRAARAHAADMLLGNFVGHTSSTGAGFESRMRALKPGVMMLPRMAENAARERSKGAPDAAKAGRLFQQWVKSAPHAKTLRSRDHLAVAIGVIERNGQLYAVQIFVGPELKSNMFGTKPTATDEETDSIY
jgi:uncharacterized protein YkwD